MYYLLFYDYPTDVVEKRAPYREDHLRLAREWVERGALVLGGAVTDPMDGAVIVFNVADRAMVEEFVAKDPYVANGVATAWRIRPWTVVVGAAI